MYNTKDQAEWLCPTLKSFLGENLIAQLNFLVILKNMLESCGVCKSNAVRVLTYFSSDSAEEVYKVYNANGVGTDAHSYYGTLPVVTKVLIQFSLSKEVI